MDMDITGLTENDAIFIKHITHHTFSPAIIRAQIQKGFEFVQLIIVLDLCLYM